MNIPGTPNGNWGYRLDAELLSSKVAAKLARLTETYERLPSSLVAIRERRGVRASWRSCWG
jgi:4-alpha-glucanotransferase